MIRIGGRKYRGKKLEVPSYLEVPTKEVVRLAMMNAVQSHLFNADVLDLCAGSGALGIEALSRGASSATFVEKNPEGAKTIERNLSSLSFMKVKVEENDALTYLKETQSKFHLVFFDPPYSDRELYSEVFSLIEERGILIDGGAFIFEYEGESPLKIAEGKGKSYRHGRSRFGIIWKL